MRAILIAAILMSGCSDNPFGAHHRGVLYVRNPLHHCELFFRTEPKLGWSYAYGHVEGTPGRDIYRCDMGVMIGFDDGEEKP